MTRVALHAPLDDVVVALAPADGLGGALPIDVADTAGLPRWRADERLAARALLRLLLHEAVGPAAASARVCSRVHGQPYLDGWPDLAVSMSHSGGWVAAGVHVRGGTVGVDVQEPYAAGERLVRRCCGPHADRLLTLEESARAVETSWVWSVQEACVKARGTGLAGRPWTVPVTPFARHGRWAGLRWCALRGRVPLPVSCAAAPPAGGADPHGPTPEARNGRRAS
ncbi:4'-phosphopantetheinyl transferase family protein [Cellulomonas wangsupingiae]|uniref:4'-phosphopantetheinyl transferase superfamily protein n=1 Tax=Cellulomonas wangsupingiae TaxID=2968085 RepID=A0ABY5KA12_9CELL|nr:4'-phosphopantetheinyl transferase superfamily protein [Cellulomonas wangsupingiae]MCC2333049.1 hypothetical protein [Cellulomonas wangsupingiae]UUI66765.1 hypothetical protein NP075_08730 [Cellulomonas wangsupingiae]